MTYDFALLGATGFTGGLTADYLAIHAPDGATWAIAGRDRAALETVAARIAEAGGVVPAIEVADVTDAASLRRLAESTRVLASTVGPYALHGGPVVAACAEAGTAYCDLTGEPEFVDRMWLEHHATAERTGARLVHSCGFDSIPHDIGVLHTVRQLPSDVPIAIRGYVRASADVSAGTSHSALGAFAGFRSSQATAKERRRLEGRPEGRRIRGLPERPGRGESGSGWALPLPTIDPQVVLRSARALPSYGPDFSYGHYAQFRRLPMAVGAAVGVGALVVGAQIPPVRKALLRAKTAGEGPSEAKRARSWFQVRFAAEAGGARLVTEAAGGDPGYTETARMLGESTLALAYDDLPDLAGQLTTATALGDALLARLPYFRTL
ncbi:saccharopine dehydrogenase NADP-binding domain-containing protein [Mumia sp. ZJ1417]|uniref:saccharopine dehydrogenase family protein n=1 Tax=unclassified Mumia TaxID=2621872 RepID=UPI00141F3924|nr:MULTISPECIES: saccharopine dehydrogenase NADP-binding domain-containing protein [unclassified Mumia]QMW67494.1 saccharopine dehydrogenase NADP-binding domain-containing protein [Mumia sp. ZJ1417]